MDVLTAELPFRFSFGHALAARRSSTNVVVRVRLDDGTVGYGEGVPREYVTGETVEQRGRGALRPARAGAARRLDRAAGGRAAAARRALPLTAPDGAPQTGGRCALELALLDAFGQHFELLRAAAGSAARARPWSATTPCCPSRRRSKLVALALVIRALGVRQVKIKVGADLDARAALARAAAPRARARRRPAGRRELRLDAPTRRSPRSSACAQYRISCRRAAASPADDLEGLRRSPRRCPSRSSSTSRCARSTRRAALAERRPATPSTSASPSAAGCSPSLEIARIARERGLSTVVGAQVGESGILSAAGRHAGRRVVAPRYVEGSGGRLLLKEDLTAENVLPGRRAGRARSPATASACTVREQRARAHTSVEPHARTATSARHVAA